ncbi:MAG: glycosyltransferase family 39 protein, partial [Anaerolineaceae bacterium]|nr:glycosyltransferase family 39 protein [Anaerolineaceae bacterium]
INLSLWALSLILFLIAFIETDHLKKLIDNIRQSIKSKQIFIKITPWLIFVLVSTILVFYFRFYRLNEVLGEMFSDHAEKLLDVYDVLNGKFPVFFIRNTGREFFQFYWTSFLAIVFNTGISFMSLKIGTALAGFLTLPYIYLLGNELRNKWVGILALLFAGIAYWPNVISRVGLRFPFYPMFAAPALFYLIRGLRQRRRNDFIYSGIALGLGLHGYSSTRFLPVVVVIAVILFLIHKQSKGIRNQTINAFITLVMASFILFLPLFKFSIVNPEAVSYRMMTRLTSSERAISEPPGEIFLKNLWNAEIMFFYSNGGTWVHSIPNRPALDMVSAGLYLVGSIIVLIQYLKYRNWEDLFLLLAVPLLMMPSILSLAFPDENPSLNRTAGAIIPVFILVAIGFERVFYSVWRVAMRNGNKIIVSLVGLALFLMAALINHDLVFNQFDKQFMAGAWNTSQIGAIIRGFSESTGNADRAYVVPSPHWVDTRLVGINAGYPTKDYALWPEQFNQLNIDDGEKLVILKPDNQDALSLLKTMFPNGILYNYDSGFEGKDFHIYHIPPLIIQDENTIVP